MKTNEQEGILMRITLGKLGKTFLLTRWLPTLVVLQALCLGMAWRAYPHYSFFDHDISFLGLPRRNPMGWWFWSVGMGITGIMMWPVARWGSLQMDELTAGQTPWQRKFVAMGSVTSRCSCYGLLALALIPQYPSLVLAHGLGTAFGFGGLYLTVLFYWSVFLWGASLGVAKKARLLTVAVCWGPVGFLVTQGYRFFAYGEIGRKIRVTDQSHFLRFSLWEWMLFFCAMTSVFLLLLLLPDRKNAQ